MDKRSNTSRQKRSAKSGGTVKRVILGLGLIISFIPALHEVANFSWFIGVFLGATTYRWLARDEREVQAKAAFRSGAVAKKE